MDLEADKIVGMGGSGVRNRPSRGEGLGCLEDVFALQLALPAVVLVVKP